MSTKYQHGDAVPTEVLAKRLDELSDAVVARMQGNNAKFQREFTCRIPCELDRDADVVLCEAAIRLSEQEKKISELERDIGFLQCCVNSGEVATINDRPSFQNKGDKK